MIAVLVTIRMTFDAGLATSSGVFSVATRITPNFLGTIRRAYLKKEPTTATPRFPAAGHPAVQGDCQKRYEQSGGRVHLWLNRRS